MMIQGYIRLAIIIIVIISVLYLPILFVLKKKGKGFTRQLSYLLCFLAFFFIVFATIILFNIPIDFSPEEHFLNLIPFGRFGEEVNVLNTITDEIMPNIMIFIPLGVFIPIAFEKMRKLYKTAFIVFLVTFSVEFFQYFIGRKSDIDDIMTNLLGGIIGYGIFKVLNYLFKDKKWWNKFMGKDLTI